MDAMTTECQKRLARETRVGHTTTSAAPETAAQVPPPPVASKATETFVACVIARPLPSCSRMLVLDLSLRTGTHEFFSADFGVMVNAAPRTAVGLVGMLTGRDGVAGWGGKLRYRRWLGSSDESLGLFAVDVSAGMYLYHLEELTRFGRDQGTSHPGGIAEVAFALTDLLAVSAGVNTWRSSVDADLELVVSVGIRLGFAPLIMGLSRLPRVRSAFD